MRFKFYPKESKLYDFLNFPRLIFYNEEEEAKDILNELQMTDYKAFINDAENRLAPYKKEIEKFYFSDFFHRYNFINLITRTYSIFGFENELEYLNMLLTLEDNEIVRAVVHSLITINEEHTYYSDDAVEEAERISSNKERLISYIKELPIEAATKWNLFLIVEEAKGYMKAYVDLMLKILPIFQSIYSVYEAEIIEYGERLTSFLNKEGPKALEDITFSILKADLIDSEETNILISLVYSYVISIMTSVKIRYLAWGLKMEEAIQQMKEINENKMNERIQVFKNLGDKTRYEVLKLIALGKSSTKEIANSLGVSSATISYHISNLLTSKIIKLDKIDNKHIHVVDYKFLEGIIKDFMEDIRFPQND